MDNGKTVYQEFTSQDIKKLDVELKIGILGTITPQGLPHLTMISTLQPCAPGTVAWGQFTEGSTKKHVLQNPKTGFLMMTLDKELWRGKAIFRDKVKSGPEHEKYNNLIMFRYNAYFGVHTVYYMDLVEQYGQEQLPMGAVVFAAIQTMAARMIGAKRANNEVLNPWGQQLINKIDNLKFISYVGADGFPVIIPAIQTQVLDPEHLVFSLGAFKDDLRAIQTNAAVAVFGMTFDMEDVLVKGIFKGFSRVGGINCGVIEMDYVYNPMPPLPGQIYPPQKVEAVKEF